MNSTHRCTRMRSHNDITKDTFSSSRWEMDGFAENKKMLCKVYKCLSQFVMVYRLRYIYICIRIACALDNVHSFFSRSPLLVTSTGQTTESNVQTEKHAFWFMLRSFQKKIKTNNKQITTRYKSARTNVITHSQL